ncbi:MAG: hypothetical protein ABFD25_13145 [Clostridiaceae bacterium]
MKDDQEIYDRINELLEDTDYGYEIKDVSELEDFLEDEENQQLEEYEEIEKLYTMLMEDTDFEED